MNLSQRLRGGADAFSGLRAALNEKHPGQGWSWAFNEHSNGASYLLVKVYNEDRNVERYLSAETPEEAEAMVRAGRWVRE